jgi:hypothetical protein
MMMPRRQTKSCDSCTFFVATNQTYGKETPFMAGKTTKAEQPAHAPMAYLVDFTRFDGPMTQLWTRPFEAWLRWQVDMLKAAEPVAIDWFERRRQATEAALETIEKLSHCSDLNEAVSIQRDWLEGAAKRLTADFETLTEQATFLSREAVEATRSAAQSAPEAPSPKHRAGPKEAQIDAAA